MWQLKLMRGAHGLYQSCITKPRATAKHWFSLACQPICEQPLRRPHLTCTVCRGRRMYYRKMPRKIPVTTYTIFIRRDRRWAHIKDVLSKPLKSLLEMLAN